MPAHQRTRRKLHHATYKLDAFDHPWIGQTVSWKALGTQRGNSFTFADRVGVIILYIPAGVPPRIVWTLINPDARPPAVFPDISCRDRFMVMQPSDRTYLRTIDQFLLPYCAAINESHLVVDTLG